MRQLKPDILLLDLAMPRHPGLEALREMSSNSGPHPVRTILLTAAAEKLNRPTQRLIVFGSGNLFAGSKLEPAQEKLLLHSVNWLTDRADRLPQAELPPWSFPRVQMSERDAKLWRLGIAVGLPLLAVYVGLTVMMVRRLR